MESSELQPEVISAPIFNKSNINKDCYFAFFTERQLEQYRSFENQIKHLQKENEEFRNKIMLLTTTPVESDVQIWKSTQEVFSIYESQGVYTLFEEKPEFPENFYIGNLEDLTELIGLLAKVFTAEVRKKDKNEEKKASDNQAGS
jgi:hypothetical protein